MQDRFPSQVQQGPTQSDFRSVDQRASDDLAELKQRFEEIVKLIETP